MSARIDTATFLRANPLTRWTPYAVDGGHDAYGEMGEDEDGDWVSREDHDDILTAALDEIDARVLSNLRRRKMHRETFEAFAAMKTTIAEQGGICLRSDDADLLDGPEDGPAYENVAASVVRAMQAKNAEIERLKGALSLWMPLAEGEMDDDATTYTADWVTALAATRAALGKQP